MNRRPGISNLLLIANIFILGVPIAAVIFFQLWDSHLVRVTEERLISESALLTEVWRDLVVAERGLPAVDARSEPRVVPVEATLDLNYGLLPPPAEATRFIEKGDAAEWRAAPRIQPLVDQLKRTTLSGVRILDTHGCVVVTSGTELGGCLDHLEEVEIALRGNYAAVARERKTKERPPLEGPSRRGSVRVFTATPVRLGAELLGVVRLSRTSSSPLEAVWKLRYTVLLGILGCVLLMAGITLFFSRVISKPVRDITRAAEAIARGEPPQPFVSSGLRPAEVDALSSALNRMTAQLTDRATYIALFAANVSHELKTPITGIRGAVELLRDEWEEMSPEQRKRFLGNIDADANRMERLVTRLLQLARIQSSPEAGETVSLREFFSGLAERYGEQVRIDTTASPDNLRINPDHLETAVHNLIDNALRHGEGRPVDVTVSAADGHAMITVRDRGSGISEGNRTRIFERFFTTERDRGGTGLGLSLVKAVAENRGGSVSFESGASGTTFRLIL